MAKSQTAMFEDSIGEIVDQYIREGLSADVIVSVLRYEAGYVPERASELSTQASDARP